MTYKHKGSYESSPPYIMHICDVFKCVICFNASMRYVVVALGTRGIFHKRATKYRSLLRKMTYKHKGSYESSRNAQLQDMCGCPLVAAARPSVAGCSCLLVAATHSYVARCSCAFLVYRCMYMCTMCNRNICAATLLLQLHVPLLQVAAALLLQLRIPLLQLPCCTLQLRTPRVSLHIYANNAQLRTYA